MEGLKMLERMHKTLLFIDSRDDDVRHKNPDSNRFIANLILLMVQPCGELNIDAKCQLISEFLPKLSAKYLNEASLWLDDGGKEKTENAVSVVFDNIDSYGPLESECEDMAMIGIDSMQRGNSTLEDFCRSYFMFHDMDASNPHSIFQYLPLLSFTESYIYQMDRLNEKVLQLKSSCDPVFHGRNDMGANGSWFFNFVQLLRTDPFKPLVLLLEKNGLLTQRILQEFKCGEEYWRLERKLCSALNNNTEISIEDVMRAIHLKSFDYRVLNYILYQLRGSKVNEIHVDFLSVSEFLVEVSDDLFDYEDDVFYNNFNILRMFVRIYGASAAPAMLAKIISEAEEKYESLLKTLDPELSRNYYKRCEEATIEGGKTVGPPLGTWSIPSVIGDEEFYRLKILKNNI